MSIACSPLACRILFVMPSGVVEKGWQTFYHFIDFLSGWSSVKVWIWDVIVWGVWRAEGLCDTVCFTFVPRRKRLISEVMSRWYQAMLMTSFYWLMIAFITCNSNLVPLPEGLCSSNPCRFEFSIFWVFARMPMRGSCSLFSFESVHFLVSAEMLVCICEGSWRKK